MPGHHLFYRRECLLPCLELQVILKERGREELGDISLLLMSLLNRGVHSIESLSRLTGMPPPHPGADTCGTGR